MEPGLRLLIQLVLQLAPSMINLVQKQSSVKSVSNISTFSQVIAEFLPTIDMGTKNAGIMAELIQPNKYLATQLKISREQQETLLKLPEIQRNLDKWPLKLSPTQLLESGESYRYNIPLKIFFAPPQVRFDELNQQQAGSISEKIESEKIELKLAEGLREFIHSHYSLHSLERPTEFLAGAWENRSFHSESGIKILFNSLKKQPTLVLESENDGDYFNFRIAYWGFGQTRQANYYYYQTISRFSYREILQESAKNRALAWKKVKNQLLLLGEDLSIIDQLGGDNTTNLAIWEKLEKLQSQGVDISGLSLKYQVNQQDWSQLCQILLNCHCLVVAWIADAYHLIYRNVQPLLPTLLPRFLLETLDSGCLEVMGKASATSYKQVYEALKIGSGLAPRIEDEAFVIKLKEYFTAIDDRQSIADLDGVLAQIDLLKNSHNSYNSKSVNVIYTLTGHLDKVCAIAISPDGEVLVSGCADKTVHVWNIQHGCLIRTLNGNLGAIASVAISADGNFLAVGSCEYPQGNVKVWNLQSGKLLYTLSGHQKSVNVVVISPDGKVLASGSNRIKIWRLQTGDRICTLWHSSTVNAIAISQDGNILASGSSDKKIRLWNPRNGDPLRIIAGHTEEVTSIAIHPDGKILFSGSGDNKIKVWDLSTGRLLNTLTGHLGRINSLAVSPDGQFLWSGSDDTTIKMWNISTGEVLHTLIGHTVGVNSLALSLDGKLLASGSSDKTIKVWQLSLIDINRKQ